MAESFAFSDSDDDAPTSDQASDTEIDASDHGETDCEARDRPRVPREDATWLQDAVEEEMPMLLHYLLMF
ncbi:hypothetical protein P43SY_009352 [Pythium insidiosum]|uniref:Uncharacterized protein n=1 Tax=Pythium insidiosum TaxID=114742 RepID=A0AAD5LJN3_PYTIN|nr:hypothetical protein P43SY_009352 [Pythium insidiosum]